MAVTLPFVLLLLDFWPLRRWSFGGRAETMPLVKVHGSPPAGGPDHRHDCQALFLEKLPFFLLAAASGWITFVAQKNGGTVRSLSAFPINERIANAAVSYARYLGKTFWPTHLSVFYPHPGHWPAWEWALSGILIAGLCLWAVWAGRRHPFVPVGWFWFVGTLIPTIGLVQVSNQSIADRYTYLPSIGLFILLVWGGNELRTKFQLPQTAVAAAMGFALIACAVATEVQLRYWKNSESLFGHALAVTQQNFVAHENLGISLLDRGRIDDAIEQFNLALAIQPRYADARSNLGNALLQAGRIDEAILEFEKTIALKPNHEPAQFNLGHALLQKGRVDDAIARLQTALKLRADDFDAHLDLGIAFSRKGQTEEATAQYRTALRIQPDSADAHNNLGSVLLQAGKPNEAISHFQQALAFHPNHANAHYNLGNALLAKGDLTGAIAHLQQAVSIQPDDPDAHNQLGTALALNHQLNAARSQFERALQLRPDFPEARNNLTWILSNAGRASEAVAPQREAAR